MRNLIVRLALCLACLTAVAGGVSSTAAQQTEPPAAWLSNVIWAASLPDAGAALAEHLNQIDAACNVDVDVIQSTNGAGPEGAVYAFLVVWACPETNPNPSGLTWQSALIWDPTLEGAGLALAAHLNQTDATCLVDVDDVQSTNGAGPEGILYAFLVTWAC